MPNNETDNELKDCAGCGAELARRTDLHVADPDYIDARDTVGFTPDIICFGKVEDIDAEGLQDVRYPLVVISDGILPTTVDYTWCSDNCFAQHLLRMLEAENARG